MSKRVSRTLTAGVLALAMGLSPTVITVAQAQEPPRLQTEGGLSHGAKAGVGCLATSGALTGWALYAGPTETLMLAAGGLMAPGGAKTMFFGLLSTLIAASCSLGAGATPAVLWAWEQQANIIDAFAAKVSDFGTVVAGSLGFGSGSSDQLAGTWPQQ